MNRNVFRPFLFLAILVLTVGLACGIDFGTQTPEAVPPAQPIIQPSPQPIQPVQPALPTEAPPPTAMPEPTSTPPPAPQTLSEMVKIFETVAKGTGVSEASAYDEEKSGVHPIIIIAPDDELEEWNTLIPESWRPVNVSQTELVATVTYTEVTLERKQYFASGQNLWVSRIRIDTEIVIREAKTGQVVTSIMFEGSDPPYLPTRFASRPPAAFYGTSVAYEIAILWMKDFVEK